MVMVAHRAGIDVWREDTTIGEVLAEVDLEVKEWEGGGHPDQADALAALCGVVRELQGRETISSDIYVRGGVGRMVRELAAPHLHQVPAKRSFYDGAIPLGPLVSAPNPRKEFLAITTPPSLSGLAGFVCLRSVLYGRPFNYVYDHKLYSVSPHSHPADIADMMA